MYDLQKIDFCRFHPYYTHNNYNMGCYSSKNLLSSCYDITSINKNKTTLEYKVALKLPHGLQYLDFDGNTFIYKTDVTDWVTSAFKNKKFTNYINYNDEHDDKMCSVGGHCKGCFAWNDKEICWLIHSVPRFMVRFDNEGFVDEKKTHIYHSEEIYGQSFVFLSGIPIEQLSELLQQLAIMKPFVDKDSSTSSLPILSLEVAGSFQINSIAISIAHEPTVYHIAKSPKNHIDIFSDMIQTTFGGKWHCETWIRGHHCPDHFDINSDVIDNKNIIFGEISYSSSHDHSKYACNDADLVYIGDLNRMTSQYGRGGGGVIIKNPKLNKMMRAIMAL
uniref:Uncharacterized protein n=1 Tax=viral metagenome TaxID=1070528 RepID=A0A6C0D443_9ZZZZ